MLFARCALSVCSVFVLLHSAVAGSPGVCTVTATRVKYRIEMDRKTMTRVLKTYDEPVQREQCCDGYQSKSQATPLQCIPQCDPPCVNSVCEEPDTCICLPGHQLENNSTSSCYHVCSACVNGECRGQQVECECYPGYERNPAFPHICNAVCSPACVNAVCTDPGKCECFHGYLQSERDSHICTPNCSETCIFGTCTAPGVCSCYDGYVNDLSTPSICEPVCNRTCEGGFCATPETCRCHTGHLPHPRDPFRCDPPGPDNYSLDFCELRMPKALKHNSNSDCFMVKDKAVVIGDSRCRSLLSISQPSCSQQHSCSSAPCILEFRCSVKRINGSREVHCDLGLEYSGEVAESAEGPNSTIGDSHWMDVVLVVNSFQRTNSSLHEEVSQTRQWTLHTMNKWPVCGTKDFKVEISGCAPIAVSSINTSLVTWLNVVLILSFLVLVSAGVGGFLWMRHRKLHDPLNYREDIIRGYRNECYAHQVQDLVPDDEMSDHDSFAPL